MPRSLCQHCARPIEFPEEMTGQEVSCPDCNKPTMLTGDGSPVVRVRLPSNLPRSPFVKRVDANLSAPADDGTRPEATSPRVLNSPVGRVSAAVLDNMEQVIIGKRDRMALVIASFFAEGHVLLEDVPGVAKTMLARALAQSVGCTFKRLQCTPDLLPTDITGASVFNPKTTEFEFRPGPLFAQIILADELNRATPRAQSALLEAMQERQVTVDGVDYPLERPFLIIGTQNPIDHEGTFPLPEAQLDRFLIRLALGYPALAEEGRMLDRFRRQHPIEAITAVASAAEILACQEAVREVHVDPKVRDYLLQIVLATRAHSAVILGASPRASLALFHGTQALAAVQGFDFVLPDHVKEMAPYVLTHRLIIHPEKRLRKVNPTQVLGEILNQVPVPTLPGWTG